jgi:hypothetical protein
MVRLGTHLRHIGEDRLTGEGSRRRWRLGGGAHRRSAGGAAGGTSGRASGHRGVMVELKDGALTPDEDPRRPAMRSSSAAATPDSAQGFAGDCCNLQKGRSEQRAGALGGTESI